jgi:hypothetical protein
MIENPLRQRFSSLVAMRARRTILTKIIQNRGGEQFVLDSPTPCQRAGTGQDD